VAEEPIVYTNCYISVEINEVTEGEMGKLLFTDFTPPTWSTETHKHKFYGNQATTQVLHGGARVENWGPAHLGRGVDPEHILYKWVQEIRKKGPAGAKKDVTIKVEAPDESGEPTGICTWVGTGAVITEFSQAASNASTNEIMTEEVAIEAEMWDMKDGEGSDIGEGPPS
jgi:phage tail-like protein